MEINKQLFEDVLSGKLKGEFAMRNGSIIPSDWLKRAQQNKVVATQSYPYILECEDYFYYYYTENGRYTSDCSYHNLDIINFIPDTNMKTNELTIEIPEGKIVDWDESKKQNKIVLKDKQITYENVCEKIFEKGYFMIVDCGGIKYNYTKTEINHSNNSASYRQLECILAKNKLANVAKYLNDGWKPGKNYAGNFDAWVLYLTPDKDYIGYVKIDNCGFNSNALFKTKELAQQAIKILGEETVKLALEPLGV